MDAPRPAGLPMSRPRRARGPTAPLPPRVCTLNDLDLDCLALILSMVTAPGDQRNKYVDCKARFAAPPLACKALAAAAARPSVAWAEMYFRMTSGQSDSAWSSFRAAMQRVAPSVQRLDLMGFSVGSFRMPTSVPIPDILAILEAVAPYIGNLRLFWMLDSVYAAIAAAPIMRSAAHLVELIMERLVFRGPPGMVAVAFTAIMARYPRLGWQCPRFDVSKGETSMPARLHRDILAAAAAAGRPVQLLRLGRVYMGDTQGGAAPDLAVEVLEAMGAASLVAVDVDVRGDSTHGQPGAEAGTDACASQLVALVARLPALRDLRIGLMNFMFPTVLDLGAAPARLSRLVITEGEHGHQTSPEVRLPLTTAASLQVLALESETGYAVRPPECLRHAGNALTALIRLEYGQQTSGEIQPGALDLAAWGNTAEYWLPALRVLTACSATGFTVDGQGGRVGPSGREWVAGLLATVPRLECLTLAERRYSLAGVFSEGRPPLFSCRCRYFSGPARCRSCIMSMCDEANTVRILILSDLSAGAEAAGRRLAVVYDDDANTERIWNKDLGGMEYGPAPR